MDQSSASFRPLPGLKFGSLAAAICSGAPDEGECGGRAYPAYGPRLLTSLTPGSFTLAVQRTDGRGNAFQPERSFRLAVSTPVGPVQGPGECEA